jgi:regulator of replication initiation timing
MYYWILRTYEKHRIEHENLLDRSAIHWYELYKEREKYFQATPIKLFWESIKEQFPDAYIDTELLPKTIIEVEEDNKQLRAENEKLKEALREIAEDSNYREDSDNEVGWYIDNAYEVMNALKEKAQQALNEVKE